MTQLPQLDADNRFKNQHRGVLMAVKRNRRQTGAESEPLKAAQGFEIPQPSKEVGPKTSEPGDVYDFTPTQKKKGDPVPLVLVEPVGKSRGLGPKQEVKKAVASKPAADSGPKIRTLFDQMSNGGEVIDKKSVKQYLKRNGFKGIFKVSQGIKALMKRLDTEGEDKQVRWPEFVRNVHKLLPKVVLKNDKPDPTLVKNAFEVIAGGEKQANKDIIIAYAKPRLPPLLRVPVIKGIASKAIATLTLAVLGTEEKKDQEGQRYFTEHDLECIVNDINRERGQLVAQAARNKAKKTPVSS